MEDKIFKGTIFTVYRKTFENSRPYGMQVLVGIKLMLS